MVNYLYAPNEIESNHEAYAEKGTVAASSAIRKLARAAPAGVS
jgi:malonyl-CoA decarboxylase